MSQSQPGPSSPPIALVGPTCTGKTVVGIALAQQHHAEIISADSRQIYRYMDIGTAKPTADEQKAVRHHLIDIIDPDVRFSAGEYARRADAVIADLAGLGVQPLFVGGAGLYLQAVMGGLFEAPEIPDDVRRRIKKQYVRQDSDMLHEMLKKVDAAAAARIHPNDRQRIERALEVYEATGIPLTEWHQKKSSEKPTRPLMMIGLNRERGALYRRIDRRVEKMIESGLIEEVQHLLKLGYHEDTFAMKTFGYAEILSYLRGELSLQDAADHIQQQTRRYAKRQLTWFRNREDIHWIDVNDDTDVQVICDRITEVVSRAKEG